MKVAVFSTKPYDETFLKSASQSSTHEFTFFETRLGEKTVSLAAGYEGVCVFVHDQLTDEIIQRLAEGGTKLIALRCAGFNNVNVAAAQTQKLKVVRVPAYSPHAVAEHAVAMMLSLNRKIYKAYAHVREGDFSLHGLMGFDMYQKTVGIVGTGKIGAIAAKILKGFDCRLLAYDVHKNPEVEALGAQYVTLTDLFEQSDIVTLHCPLMHETYHMINQYALKLMKKGVMLINTSRGALIDTQAVIEELKSGRIGYLGLDVYEEEEDLFYEDKSLQVIQDDVFSRLITFPNVIITGHQAFFTQEALQSIAETTVQNITAFEQGKELVNEVTVDRVKK
ncbi:MAG TPA: hydroxyacid dehydrogenase [Verrucomicrobia bacterium]|nr:MAG: hydroxyacid dehydrogenase [Lentisphaerae bacterium GWF2_57_35]HBA85882.1 hydroxyacid dehydrogenase [Verrucomicrobiota bacterium]